MRIGIVSDTHAHVGFTQAAVRMLESLDVAAVLHCGDIGSVGIVGLFAPWPSHFVFGNVDDNVRELTAAIEAAGQTCHGCFADLTLGGRRIAMLHGDDLRRLDETIRSGEFALVCHGHTHVARQEQLGPTLVLNPGALYRANPRSLAIVELDTLEAVNIPLD